jgi:hypothetical protein
VPASCLAKSCLALCRPRLIEGRKDELTAENLEDTAVNGEVIEDYGIPALLLHFTKADRILCHIVLEYLPRAEEVTIVTALRTPNSELLLSLAESKITV